MADVAENNQEEIEKDPAIKLPSLSTRVQQYEDYEEATRENRRLAIRDRNYVDNHQLTQAQLDKFKERKQPPIVKNRIARKVNFILGEEIQKRVNPAARPRTPEQQDDAEAATDALRFSADEEHFDEVRSAVFKNQIVEGFGGALKEMEEDSHGYKHRLRHIEWDRLAYDEHSRAPDFSDASWLAVAGWYDVDDAIASYPHAEAAIRAAVKNDHSTGDDTAQDSPRGWVSSKDDRVMLLEMFSKVGEDWYRSVFTKDADIVPCEKTWLLDEDQEHSVCPLVMVSCYIDRNGNRYGVVRSLISPQDMYNKGSSKVQHMLAVNQVISETDAITDPDDFMDELAKPDGHATGIRPGGLKDGSVVIKNGGELSVAQFQMIQEAKGDIDDIGPTAATIPDLPSSSSGIAFQRRQQAAAQELGPIFDYIRSWQRRVFELDWLSWRLTGTEEQWLRVTDDRELTGYRFVAINRAMTRAQRFKEMLSKVPPPPIEKALKTAAGEFADQIAAEAAQLRDQQGQQLQQQGQQIMRAIEAGQADPRLGEQLKSQMEQLGSPEYLTKLISSHPLMQEQVTANQVAKMLVDIVLDEAPDTAVLAQEQFSTLTEMGPTIAQARPDIMPTYLKILIKSSQLPNKRELMQELEKEPGQQDQAQQQQQQAMQQQMIQLQVAMQQATIAVNQTRAELQQAQTEKTAAETQLIAVNTQLAPAKAEVEKATQHAQALSTMADVGAKTAGHEDGKAESVQEGTNPGSNQGSNW